MDTNEQMELFQTYLQEYYSSNQKWDTDEIRDELKEFGMKIKAGLKVALEAFCDEEPHMMSLSYAYKMGPTWVDVWLWVDIYTKEEYEIAIEEYEGIEDISERHLVAKYSPDIAFPGVKDVFDAITADLFQMIDGKKFQIDFVSDKNSGKENDIWGKDEFSKFNHELEEVCLKCFEDIKKEGILEEFGMEDILFQLCSKDEEDEENSNKQKEWFKRLNQDEKAGEEYSEYLDFEFDDDYYYDDED